MQATQEMDDGERDVDTVRVFSTKGAWRCVEEVPRKKFKTRLGPSVRDVIILGEDDDEQGSAWSTSAPAAGPVLVKKEPAENETLEDLPSFDSPASGHVKEEPASPLSLIHISEPTRRTPIS